MVPKLRMEHGLKHQGVCSIKEVSFVFNYTILLRGKRATVLMKNTMRMENRLKFLIDKLNNTITTNGFNRRVKLSLNHMKKNEENMGNIIFVVEEECPGSSAKIIYHGEKESCTCECWNFVGALNIHVQEFKTVCGMYSASGKGQPRLLSKRMA